jgi:sRNA-binding regulator protein Hfq
LSDVRQTAGTPAPTPPERKLDPIEAFLLAARREQVPVDLLLDDGSVLVCRLAFAGRYDLLVSDLADPRKTTVVLKHAVRMIRRHEGL